MAPEPYNSYFDPFQAAATGAWDVVDAPQKGQPRLGEPVYAAPPGKERSGFDGGLGDGHEPTPVYELRHVLSSTDDGTFTLKKSDGSLPIMGQGVLAVKANVKEWLHMSFKPEDLGGATLYFELGVNSINLFYGDRERNLIGGAGAQIPLTKVKDTDEGLYLEKDTEEIYWLSLDRDNGIISYGKYYLSKANAIFQAVLKKRNDKEGVMVWVDQKYSWLESVKQYDVSVDNKGEGFSTVLQPLPIVLDLPPNVVGDNIITLRDLENGTVTVSQNLPQECQRLYGNVAGPNIAIDREPFKDFAKALQRSVTTEGCLGWNMCQKKAAAGELGHDIKGTYLRITLGKSIGNSPGIPYVLEIWPPGHHSPVHDHGDSYAVIKVLHGTINVNFYDSLTKKNPRGTAILNAGQVTWLGSQHYQVHKLENTRDEVCCTLQCYQFGNDDTKHDEHFYWMDDNSEKQAFNPNSDMTFGDFFNTLKAEWDNRPRN